MEKKTINLRGLQDVLSEKQMKNVMGGSGGSGGSDCKPFSSIPPCCPNESWSWWYLRCMSNGDTPKIDSCEGKSEGDDCTWIWNGSAQYGFCTTIGGWTQLHCAN